MTTWINGEEDPDGVAALLTLVEWGMHDEAMKAVEADPSTAAQYRWLTDGWEEDDMGWDLRAMLDCPPLCDPWELESRLREAARAGDEDLMDELLLEASILRYEAAHA